MCRQQESSEPTKSTPGSCDFDESTTNSPSASERRPRNNRRRARRACLSCRTRKVRCDVVERVPCGNCKWDGTECVVVGRRLGGYFRVNPSLKKKEDMIKDNGNLRGVCTEISVYDTRSRKSSDAIPHCRMPTDHYAIGEDMEYTTQMLNLLAEYTGHQTAALGQGLLKSEGPSQRHLPTTCSSPSSIGPLSTSLPGFINPISSCIASDDQGYLQSKGALTLPDEKLQNALVWSFFEYVYPFMPVVDLEQFVESVYNRDGSSGQISLLLFQAVLFAGTAHVNIELLKEAGFHSRRQARKAFFQRVRLLYDFNAESDHTALIQAILLMTLWYETPKEHRNTWHWIEVAISQAFADGLHKETATRYPPPARVQKLHRRLWWACLMRDRLVSLGMKRLPRIRDDDYDLRMLQESDLEPEPLQHTKRERLQEMCSYIHDKEKRSTLASLSIGQLSLCRSLNYYPRWRYSIFTENAGGETAEISRISISDDKAAFVACNEELVTWQNTLPDNCKYRQLSQDVINRVDTTISLHRTILHMIYYASISALHRSRFTLLLHNGESSLFDQELSKIWMQHAAIQISDMASGIHEHGLGGLLPTLSLSVVVSAAAVHLLEIKGVIQSDKRRSQEGYRRCMLIIDTLADMYVAADLAKDAMEWSFLRPYNRDVASIYEVESTPPSSKSLIMEDTAPSEADTFSMPLSISSTDIAKKQGLGDSKFPLQGPISDLGDYCFDNLSSEMNGFENCELFSDADK